MKFLVIILLLSSCAPKAWNIILDGSASHAAPGKTLVVTRWTVTSGNAVIANPNILVTSAKVTGNTIFQLYGQDNDSLWATAIKTVTFIK